MTVKGPPAPACVWRESGRSTPPAGESRPTPLGADMCQRTAALVESTIACMQGARPAHAGVIGADAEPSVTQVAAAERATVAATDCGDASGASPVM